MTEPYDFQRELIALIPHMRAFARGLCGDATLADDLAQDALLRAWRRQETFRPGTNMRGWVFMIVRNQFFSLKRRSWRAVSLDPEVAARTLVCAPAADNVLDLDDVRRAIARLPDHQREALLLVGAGELSYEEAAELTGVHIGTVKSRVSRARHALVQMLSAGDIDDHGPLASSALSIFFGNIQQAQAA
jgi:RNA polymerase sigma-70 factor (ECF subfamily)